MTDPSLLITKEEALRYNKSALEADVTRRRKNIKLFQEQIQNEKKEIKRLTQIISIIDANR